MLMKIQSINLTTANRTVWWVFHTNIEIHESMSVLTNGNFPEMDAFFIKDRYKLRVE